MIRPIEQVSIDLPRSKSCITRVQLVEWEKRHMLTFRDFKKHHGKWSPTRAGIAVSARHLVEIRAALDRMIAALGGNKATKEAAP